MKTSVEKNGDTLVVKLEGFLDFETIHTFKNGLTKLQNQKPREQIIFDFGKLQFVGSSGINAFIKSLCEFNENATVKPVYTNVKSEFKKLMTAFEEEGGFEFIDN